MRYMVTAESDIGVVRNINQDSILVKHVTYSNNEILMAIVCDGMGGLSKGEIASSMVVQAFEEWFSRELVLELKNIDMNIIGDKWSLLLKTLNIKIQEFGQKSGERLGTTFTGVLFIDDKFVVVHVGDTRLYYMGTELKQITNDHTYVAREILRGALTPEQAKTDKRRNMLLQCIGASKIIEPQVIFGTTEQGVYILCSDGFRNKVTEDEIYEAFNLKSLKNKRVMIRQSKHLIKKIKQRGEKDNISLILIKCISNKELEKRNKLSIFNSVFYKKKEVFLFCIFILMVSVVLVVS